MSYSSEVLADSPLVYWRLGDGSGTTATDSSGNSRSATWSGTPTWTTGLLSGDSDGAAKPNSQSASIADAAWMHVSAVTVEVLVKYDTVVASAGIVDRYAGGNTGVSSWLMYTPGSKFTFLIRDNFGDKLASSTASISTGTTYHVVGRADGSTVKLFVNGTEVASTVTGPLEPGTAAAVIGKAVFNSTFTNGTIDEVAIYGTALSSTRIAAHYAAATPNPNATVNAVPFTATAAAVAPTVTASSSVAAPAASATATFNTPAVTGTGSATVFAAPFAATASVAAPALSADANPSTPAATAIAAFLTPTVSATTSATVTAVPFAAMADFLIPTVSDGSGNRTVTAPAMTATAAFLAPVWTQVLDVATDTTNARHGRRRLASATVTITRPVVAPPATLTFGTKVDKALAYPVPTMVEGRPT